MFHTYKIYNKRESSIRSFSSTCKFLFQKCKNEWNYSEIVIFFSLVCFKFSSLSLNGFNLMLQITAGKIRDTMFGQWDSIGYWDRCSGSPLNVLNEAHPYRTSEYDGQSYLSRGASDFLLHFKLALAMSTSFSLQEVGPTSHCSNTSSIYIKWNLAHSTRAYQSRTSNASTVSITKRMHLF